MEFAVIIEILVKAVFPLLVKECFTVVKTSLDDNRRTEDPGDVSITYLLDVNNSLKDEVEFYKNQVESLRNTIKSRAVSDD